MVYILESCVASMFSVRASLKGQNNIFLNSLLRGRPVFKVCLSFYSFASSGQLNSSKVNGWLGDFILFLVNNFSSLIFFKIIQMIHFANFLSGCHIPGIFFQSRNKVMDKVLDFGVG